MRGFFILARTNFDSRTHAHATRYNLEEIFNVNYELFLKDPGNKTSTTFPITRAEKDED